MKRVAPKYGLACLLHEKPFAGVNGSGKHLNWSIGDDLGNNLLNPGDTPHDNMQFLFFCTAVIRAVDVWQGLLRIQHRARRQRSSPRRQRSAAGDPLGVPRRHAHRHLRAGRRPAAPRAPRAAACSTSASRALPKLPRDAGDRNRTSPFAFTGNKFEFRAVGSTQNVGLPATCLNVAVAESLDAMAHRARRPLGEGREPRRPPSRRMLKATIKKHKRIIFNGNGYSAEWQKEAGKRGLLNLKNTVDALPRDRQARGGQGVREVQGPHRAPSCTRATRSTSRPTTRPSTSRRS